MKKSLPIVFLLVVLLFGAFVWPTRWRYQALRHGSETRMVRIDRMSDRVEILTDHGWRLLQQDPEGELPPDIDPNSPYAKAFRGLK